MAKPNVFIGSSSESKVIATEIARQLRASITTMVWDQGVFRLGESYLDSLRRSLNLFDFAILVVAPDDVVTSRHRRENAPRDNVVFELGLFMGNLGQRRSLLVCTRRTGASLRLPSDLAGMSALYFDWDGDSTTLRGALRPACKTLRRVIRERYDDSELTMLPSTALAIGYFKNFVLEVCRELTDSGRVTAGDATLDVSSGEFEFVIVLPDRLAEAGHEGLRKIKRAHLLQDVKVQRGSRDFPFFAKVALKGPMISFFDCPTTLRSSGEAVDLILGSAPLTDDTDRSLMERREIANFERTLRRLLQDHEAVEFADKVKIVALSSLSSR